MIKGKHEMNSFITKEKAYVIFQFLVFFLLQYRFILNLVYATEQEYQVPKDYYLYRAIIIFMILIFAFKGRSIRIKPCVLSAGVGVAAMLVSFKLKSVNVDNYGPLFYKVIRSSWIIFILFVILLVDSISSDAWKNRTRHNKEMFFLIGAFALPIVFNTRYMLPLLMPIIALFTFELSRKKIELVLQSFAGGYYITVLHMLAKSFRDNPERYENGRYLGSFGQVESAGMFCAGAIVCIVYFMLWYMWKKRGKWYIYTVLFLLLLLPAYGVFKIASRSTMIALFILGVMCVVLVSNKDGKKAVLYRCLIAIFIVFVSVISLFIASSVLNAKVAKGEMENINYFESHIMTLTDPKYKNGYFGENSLLNVVDRVCSGRLAIWSQCIGQISWKGHAFEGFVVEYGGEYGNEFLRATHNFPILWFINYGIIGGILMLAWYFRIIIIAFKKLLEKDPLVSLASLWTLYTIGLFLFSCINWAYPVAYSFLILYSIISMMERNNS